MTIDTPPATSSNMQTNATHQPTLQAAEEDRMEPIPELIYLQWAALEDLPSQQFDIDPMQYFVLHVSLRTLHLHVHGHTRDSLAMNLSLDSRMNEVEEAVKYKDAMLTIGPPQHALDFTKLRTTFISAPTLPTQHAYTLHESFNDDTDSSKIGGDLSRSHKSGSWPVVEDVIYALLNHQEEEEGHKKDRPSLNELPQQATKKRRLSETMVPSQSNSMLYNNHSMSHHWRLVAPSQAPPSLDISHDGHMINDKTLGESGDHDHNHQSSNSSSTAQVLIHDLAMTHLCCDIPAALVAWSLANNSHTGSVNALPCDYADAVSDVLAALQAEIAEGMDALLVVQLLPMIDYDHHEDNEGDNDNNSDSVGDGNGCQACGEFVLSLHSLYS